MEGEKGGCGWEGYVGERNAKVQTSAYGVAQMRRRAELFLREKISPVARTKAHVCDGLACGGTVLGSRSFGASGAVKSLKTLHETALRKRLQVMKDSSRYTLGLRYEPALPLHGVYRARV